jgi:hypothetical protein
MNGDLAGFGPPLIDASPKLLHIYLGDGNILEMPFWRAQCAFVERV